MKIRLFGKLDISISESDWTYLCNHRFFNDNPSIDEIEAEFVSGTGITSKKIDKWEKASEKFSEYINDLREIRTNPALGIRAGLEALRGFHVKVNTGASYKHKLMVVFAFVCNKASRVY